jgi:hypothetical protein
MVNLQSIVLSTANEADLVVERLREVLKNYGFVTVSDLYDLVGLPSTFPDEKWGWTNLDDISISVEVDTDFYEVKMPEPCSDPDLKPSMPNLTKIATVDDFIKSKAVELQKIYDDRTAGDKTFEGFLYDFSKNALATLVVEMASEYFFGKKK